VGFQEKARFPSGELDERGQGLAESRRNAETQSKEKINSTRNSEEEGSPKMYS